jgi:hypothetical protein
MTNSSQWLTADHHGLDAVLQKTLDTEYFQGQDPPIPYCFTPGLVPVVVITGNNACGKSLIRRMMGQRLDDAGIKMMAISQEKRSVSPVQEQGILKLMCYGNERDDSTGYNSVKTFRGLIDASRRVDRKVALFLDEPEIGLSEEYAVSMGLELAAYSIKLPENIVGVFVVSHSRALVAQLEPIGPYHWHLGEQMNLSSWLKRMVEPLPLDYLIHKNKETFGLIEAARKRQLAKLPASGRKQEK